MRRLERTVCGVLAMALAALGAEGAALAEEPAAKAAEERAGKVVKRIVKLRAPSWSAKRGFLGVELTGLNRELRAFFKAPEDRGVLVRRVEPDSPAARAGLRVGDVLTALDGERVASTHDAIRLVGDKPAGHKARVELVRDGKPRELTAEIEVRERAQVDLSKYLQVFREGEGDEEELELDLDLEGLEGMWPPEPPAPPGPPGAAGPGRGPRKMLIFRGQEDEERTKQLELRLREMEEKLRKLEEKLQGRAKGPRPEAAPT